MSLRRRAWPYYYPPAFPNEPATPVVWYRSDRGVTTVQGPVTAAGTTPPTVTLTGTPASSIESTIEIDITLLGALGTALFSWKLNSVTQQTLQITAATFVLGTTGITASFASGTYAANNVYTSVLTVSAWADQSGNAINLAQATAANQPTYSFNGSSNGRPAIIFPGGTAKVALVGGNGLGSAQPLTFFVVAQSTQSNPAVGAYLFDTATAGATNINVVFQPANTNTLDQYDGSSANGTPLAPLQDFVLMSYFSGAASQQILNGQVTFSGANPGTTAPGNNFTLGNNGEYVTGPASCWGGNFYEIIAYTGTLSAAQTTAITTYLVNKYAINTNLPINLPGLSFWVRADLGSSSLTTTWADCSGNTNTFTAAGTTADVTLVSDVPTPNGKSLLFSPNAGDTAGAYYTANSSASMQPGTGAIYCWVVWRSPTAWPTVHTTHGFLHKAAGQFGATTGGFGFAFSTQPGPTLGSVYMEAGNALAVQNPNGDIALNTLYLCEGWYDGVSQIYTAVNGVQSAVGNGTPTSMNNASVVGIGNDTAAGQARLISGNLFEAGFIYPWTAAIQASVRAYALNRYGI